jgi:hypothetical protein
VAAHESSADGAGFDELVETARTVRPYTVTGGRTRAAGTELALEALVRAIPGGQAARASGLGLERRRILELTAERILSIAELSAHVRVPLGVVRVLVADLSAEGAVVVHGGRAATKAAATDLQVLRGVLDGISAL